MERGNGDKFSREWVWGKCATFDKSVLFWARKNSEYKYGTGFRDKSLANLDRNIFKANEDFETKEERKVMGTISIREEEIFMSGKEMFLEYITQRIQEGLGVDRYGENGSVRLRVWKL